MTGLGIGWAVAQMKAGSRVRRQEWPADWHVAIRPRPGDGRPTIAVSNGNALMTWDSVLLTEDWEIA